MSIFSSIKNWFKRTFSGGGSSRASRVSNYGGGGSRSYRDYSGGGYEHEYQSYQRRRELERQERKKKQQDTTNALASISKRTDALSSGRSSSVASSATSTGTTRVLARINEKSKATPPDPKETARRNVQKDATAQLKKISDNRKAYNKATNNRYNVDKNGTKARIAQKSQAYDVNAEKYETKQHPIATSFARGAASGVTFGGSELLAQRSKNRQRTGAEQYYQKNKNKWAEMGGEVAGSLVGFGLTGGASAKAVGKAGRVAERLVPKTANATKGFVARGTEKLASSAAIRRAAEKEAVKRFGAEGATKEVINQIARRRASTAMAELGKDAAINVTTGLASDLSHSYLDASKDGTFDRGEFARSMATNAALNTVLGGATSFVPAFRVGRNFDDAIEGAVRNVAEEQADDAVKVSLNRRRRTDVRMPEVRPQTADNAVEEAVRPQTLDEAVERAATDTVERNADEAVRPPAVESVADNVRRADEAFEFPDAETYIRELDERGEQWLGQHGHITANEDGTYNLFVNGVGDRTLTRDEAVDYITRARDALQEEEIARAERERVTRTTPLNEAENARIAGIDNEVERLRQEGLDDANQLKANKYKGIDDYDVRQGERARKERRLSNEKETIIRKEPPAADELPYEETAEADDMIRRINEGKSEKPTPPERYKAIREEERKRGLGTGKIADATTERVEPPRDTPQNEGQFASIDEDASDMGFARGGDEAAQASKNLDNEAAEIANKNKSPFEKQREAAYKENGVDLNTDNVEKMSVNEQRELVDKNFRTTEEHTKRGYTTIAVTGDKGFKGVAHQAMENGDTVIDVYHDKENLAKGAQRVMSKADEEGGVQAMIKDFTEYAEGKRKLNSTEVRDQLYDVIAAVDFANANKHEPWAADLYLAACKAGAEQTSVSGLSLRMWQKMAMSSPEYRAKAVRDQILEMFNKNKGFRKMVGKSGRGNKITRNELDKILEDNPALKNILDELDKMGEATSLDEVHEVAEKALLQARKSMPMTAFDQLTQWRYVAMLSSPKTHVRNITSNIYSATLGQLRDGVASGIEDGLIKSGKLDKTLEKQGMARADYMKSTGRMSGAAWKDSHIGLASGTNLNSLKSKLHKAQLELGTLSPTDKKVATLQKRISDLEAQIKPKQEAYDKLVGGIKRPTAKRAQEAWISDGMDKLVTNVEKFEKRVYGEGASKGIFIANDKLSNFIGNALETSDAISLERIFRERYDKILTANGWESLQKAAQGETKEAKAAAARLKKLEEYAAQEASYIAATDTYRNYNSISQAMSKFVSDSLFNYDAPMYKKVVGGVLHATMPFTKVPVNLVKRGIDYSPVGLLLSKKSLNDAISTGNITEINRACERLAEGRIGTGIAALGAGLGFIDPDGMMINTRLDKNDTRDKRKKDAGYQDYSIQAFGRNITMEWLTPTSATVFTGVEFGRMIRKAFDTFAGDNGVTFDVADLTDVPISLASSLLEPSLQLSVFQGLNNSLENVVESDNYSDTNANPWLKMGTGIIGDYARSMIPTVLGQASRTFAPYDYFVTGDTDSIYGFNSTMSRIPFLSNKMFGAKTNSWGEIKNEKQGMADYAKSAAKNLLSPASINRTTWDETDEQMMELSKTLGDEIFPKNNYNRDLTFGRNAGDVNIKMSNKELAEYNVQRGKSGSDAMADALDTVIFNRWDKDEKGHYTIPHADNVTAEQKAELIRKYEGKGIKEVVDYVINTPQFKKATPAEQKQIINKIYGSTGDDDDESRGAKRSAERYIAGKHGISADEYDYYNEVPRNAQEALAPLIESGAITYKMALDFKRGAGKTYYTTDWRGEKGGTVQTRYNKKEMLAYLEKTGYTEEEAAALYNAFKQSNAKEYGGSSSGKGRRRRSGRRRGYRRYSGGGSSAKAEVPKPKTIKASSFSQGEALVSKRRSSSAKVTPPTLKRVRAKIDLPTKR